MVLRFFMLAGVFLCISCTDFDRNNPNDPGSKDYRGYQIVEPPSVGQSSGSSSVERSSSSEAVRSSSSSLPPSSSSVVEPSSSSVAVSSSSSTPSSSSVASSSSSVVVFSSSAMASSSSVAKSSSSAAVSSSSSKPSSSSSVPPSSSSVVKSSSSAVVSSSSSKPSSSSVASSSSSSPCAGFVNGTKREHYGKQKEQFCDPRDGKKYVYVKIGTQTWMAENSNYAPESKCHIDLETNCDKYGRLYEYERAGVACPIGWRLASKTDWSVLMESINSSCSPASAGDMVCVGAAKLKATSGWDDDYNGNSGNGSDDYGFSALPGRPSRSIWCGGYNTSVWAMHSGNDQVIYYSEFYNEPCSVRCVKD